MTKTGFTFLVHGESGVGKTRLLGSMPAPLLMLDLEGRARYLPGRKILWNVHADNPPVFDGSWDVCVAVTTNFRDLERAYQWLQCGPDKHQFKSVGIDSLSFAQKRFIGDIAGVQALQQQDWGEVLRVLESLVRDYCDLTLSPTNTVESVAFSAGTKTDGNRRVPLLQGALKDSAAYMFDAVGYLYLAQDQQGSTTRNMLVEPSAGIVAKDNTDLLNGPVIPAPNLTDLHGLLVQALNPPQKESTD